MAARFALPRSRAKHGKPPGSSLRQRSEQEAKKAKKAKPAKPWRYIDELVRLQFELIKLQDWVQKQGLKVVVIFEGRDAAGKGGVIKRITESLNPRVCRVVALGTPTERERGQWYFQRYVPHLPAKGEIVLFDRSWYNRAGVERVMGFCTDEEYKEFLRACPLFEEMLIKSGIVLVKYWFSVSDEEQERRFKDRIANPIKRWKLSPMDIKSRGALGRLFARQGRDAEAHRHDAVAVERGRRRQQEEGAAELHRASSVADPLQGDPAAGDKAHAAAEGRFLCPAAQGQPALGAADLLKGSLRDRPAGSLGLRASDLEIG